MTIPFLDLSRVFEPYMPQVQASVARVVASGRYVGGPEVEEFERLLAAQTGTKYAVGVSNGLDALRLIFRAYIELGRLRRGDEVIVPANTYIASVLAVTDNGLTPVPVEPDPATMNLDWARVLDVVTPRTQAVMPVHLYGRVCYDAETVANLRQRGILVVEDNAQAVGAIDRASGRHTGALGDAAAFSFYPTKNVGALGDAGAVTTDDKELAMTLRALANYGSDRRYHNIYKGLNCRLDPVQAAALRVMLPMADDIARRRREIAAIYNESIINPAITKPLLGQQDMVWHQYVIRTPRRDELIAHLTAAGIGTDIHYATPPHLQPCLADWDHAALPVTERLATEVLSLPIAQYLTDAQARSIAEEINHFL